MTNEFTVVFAGDTSLGDWYLERAEPDIQFRLREEPMSFFAELAPLLDDRNLLIANLETILADDLVSPLEGRKKYLGWDSPDRTVSVLQQLGVDAISLANNHTMDFGPHGLAETIKHLELAGIKHFGAGPTLATASAPLEWELPINGTKRHMYVVGALKNTVPLREDYGFFADDRSWGVNPLSAVPVCTQLRQLREANPDALIVLTPHWGQNYAWASDLMWRTSKRFVGAGADLVIGHGAHMIQELANYDEGSVVFSIGNFVFNSRGRYAEMDAPPYSLIARLALSPAHNSVAANLKLYPIVCDNTRTGYRSRPVSADEAVDVVEHLARRSGSQLRDDYELDSDDRGWFVRQRRPISPRLVGTVVSSTARIKSSGESLMSARWVSGSELDSLTGLGLRQRELPRYGPGSTQACIAEALSNRGIEYTECRRVIRGKLRPSLIVTLGGVEYVFSAARIYRSLEGGDLKRIDSRAGRLVKRKDVVAAMLRSHGFTTPHGVVFDRSRANDAELYFESLQNRFKTGFCVKPVNGGLGRHVYTGITTRKRFREAFEAVSPDYDEVLVEESLVGQVYRFLWVAGKISAVRVGIPMNVIGDGVTPIRELVAKKNRVRESNPIHRHYPLEVGSGEVERLYELGLTPDAVPEAERRVFLGKNSNLHSAADIADRTDEVHATYVEVVARAVGAVPGMLVCGADVMIKNEKTPATADNYAIIELNTGPGIGSHHFPWEGQPRDVAGDIVDTLRTLNPRHS